MSNRRSIGIASGILVIAVGAIGWFIGCSVNIGPGGVSASLTIGNTTLTISLEAGGTFVIQSNTRVRNVVDVQPFAEAPADIPSSAGVYLRSSSVTILSGGTGSGKLGPNQQGAINGTAHLRVAIDAKGAVAPCDTGTDLGKFDITVTNGVVTSVSPGLYMALSTVGYFVHNAMSLCLEMEADFGATIRIQGLDVIFGPPTKFSGVNALTGTFEFRNTSALNVHIASPGEGFVDANRLVGGSSRTVVIGGFGFLDLVTFRAGRNDQVLASVTCPPVDAVGIYNVVWDGSQLRCSLEGSTEGPPEACCVPPVIGYETNAIHNQFEQGCLDIGTRFVVYNRERCVTHPGAPQGSGTICGNTVCQAAFQACCFDDAPNECSEQLCERCLAFNGNPQGEGVHCDSKPCAHPRETSFCGDEACCFESGSCDDLPPDVCGLNGGDPKGPGTKCSPNLCPQPAQPKAACCASDGTCDLVTQSACTAPGSTYNSNLSTCSPNPCPQPAPTGACCVTGNCNDLTAAECAAPPGGVYSGDGTACATVSCVQPGGDFSVTGVNAPGTCGYCPAQDLTVTWSGDPVFPVTLTFRPDPDGCPVGVDCGAPSRVFDTETNPLVFEDVIYCTGATFTRIVEYEVVIRDARGVESAPFPAPWTCDPAP